MTSFFYSKTISYKFILSIGEFMKNIVFLFIVLAITIGFSSCSKKESDSKIAENTSSTETTNTSPVRPASLPDPSGTYTDSDGTMSYNFFSSGKFSMTFMENSGSGTWSRSGNQIELTDDSGMSAGSLELGDGYLTWPNGVRLSK